MGETFDLIIKDIDILTGDREQSVIKDGYVAVKDGRIVEVGKTDVVETDFRATRSISLPGRVMTPGFVNVHTHAILSMVRGVAEDMGFAPAYTPGVPHGHEVTPDEAVALGRLGALEAMMFGSTLINDTYVHQDLTLPAMAEVGLRVYACGRIHDVDFSRVHEKIWEVDPKIGEVTLGLAVDLAEKYHGADNGRMGVQLAAHAPDTCSRELLCAIREVRDDKGLRVTTHLSQSGIEVERILEREGMRPPEFLDDVGLLDDRLLGAHCIFVDDADIQRIGAAGVNAINIAKGNATGGTMAPTTELRRAGANLTLATDNMHADMVEVMRWALCVGRLKEGRVTDFWQPEDVFQMATMNGAKAMGLENEVGSIEVGKRADVVLFDFRRPHLTPKLDLLGNLVHTGHGRDVEMVVVEGDIVVEDGKPTKVDANEIIRDAENAAQALWQRAREAV
ncbi:amidohydrolase family protein [Thalassospiraceae bacterium LMO-JJ14]|nr:amidohydrolase family protein [Thalassospiraceae bacterium LMO-JJ14]